MKPLNQNKMTNEMVETICGTMILVAFMYFLNKSE